MPMGDYVRIITVYHHDFFNDFIKKRWQADLRWILAFGFFYYPHQKNTSLTQEWLLNDNRHVPAVDLWRDSPRLPWAMAATALLKTLPRPFERSKKLKRRSRRNTYVALLPIISTTIAKGSPLILWPICDAWIQRTPIQPHKAHRHACRTLA